MCADFTRVKESLVDKILEQGQKLRNSMVQSILQNDPMSSADIIYNNKIYNTPVNSATTLSNENPKKNSKLLEAFLNGDYLTKDQEELALSTIRSMPVSDVCETTQKTLSSKCCCATCTAYSINNLNCDLRRTPNCSNLRREFTIFKFVDSLKVILQSLSLNDFGNKKVNTKETNSTLNETYFIEYYIPEVFTRNIKTKSKTDSGLESGHVRVCAKRTTNNVIHIKQTYIHSVCNFYNHNLEDYDITFLIKYKTKGQTKSQLLGISKLNLGVFKHTKNASCGKSLPIHLNEESPISVGTFKVTLQLGAGKLYFGQEFVDAVLFNEKESENNDSDVSEEEKLTNVAKTLVENKVTAIVEPVKEIPLVEKSSQEFEGELLFGFLYVSEANFANLRLNSYILCQPYCQNDTSSSRIVFNSSDPLYNFCQTIPLLYEESLLLKLRENFMVIEFWEKQDQSDILFGSTRLPLHQFYLGYRNTIIFNHLKRNKLPIIGTDWWEPIYSIDHNKLIGQVQVLTALGTEEQIRNLEIERGFKNDIVKAKFPIKTTQIKKTIDSKQPSTYFKDRTKINKKPLVKNKQDIAVQSEIKMDKEDKNPQDMLASFLKILEQRQKPPCVESSTNTDSTKTPEPQLKKTSDLLDSLQTVLSVAPPSKKPIEKPPHFKAQININSANQLPSRRKIKSKSKRLKNVKQEDNILPSTYVTFETLPGENLQITNVFPKSTQPQWNFTCQACLPTELLTNGSKRLIFKVWKKCTNAVLQPNMQTDLVLGFAALDLSVLAVGLPNVQGWFNIMDFSGKCNGQINIHVIPLEKIEKTSCNILKKTEAILPLNQMVENEEGNEVLSRALKRKFTELDEITQRLRLRLSEVVSEDSENSNDDNVTDEFEHDINNLCIEEDFDLINFEDEAKKLNQITVQTDENLLQSSDKHLIEGKHRIDTLLEKLSLMTAEASKPFTDRYVSGCSTVSNEGKDIEVIFKNLEQNSRPNITATNNYGQDFCADSGANTASGSNDISLASCSSRPNPVGQGKTSEDKKV
ncbi:unnamed protein product [Ceutorhynchus assimilis]|uniref:C2 domain-containing protein n=1 Tax=Ceutorhynchus assimilis TaxID=467358 RepID=A0A9N9MMY6_9CUCU|nr:unnamed protein product [Ceutorhynchus assimilis]